MAAAEKSVIGLAKQTVKGTAIALDASFQYMLFTRGAMAPQSVIVPLDQEVGGGAMLRDVQKMGVMSGGQLEFIPRPSSLGKLLMGALGQVTSTLHPTATLAYDHVFELGSDQFAAPYYTIRSSPGALWGEVMRDMRVSGLSLSWEGANFLRGSASFVGGLPAKAATAAWAPSTYLDSGPQFISPISDIELPAATDVKCLSGSFTAGMAIPMDQQWIVGSYSPDDFDITSRAFAVSMLLKITDGALYSRMTYDPAGTDAWVADMMREANFKLQFNSPTMAEGVHPYQLTIAGNGGSGAAANVVWTASPIGLRPGQQIVMAVTGIFLASATAPITVTLTNLDSAY